MSIVDKTELTRDVLANSGKQVKDEGSPRAVDSWAGHGENKMKETEQEALGKFCLANSGQQVKRSHP